MSTLPLQFLILTVAGWVNRNHRQASALGVGEPDTAAANMFAKNAVLFPEVVDHLLLPRARERADRADGRTRPGGVACRERLGELLRYYHRRAA